MQHHRILRRLASILLSIVVHPVRLGATDMRKSSKRPRTFGRTKAKQQPQKKQQRITIAYMDSSTAMEIYHRIKQRYSDLFRKLADM